MIVHRVRIPDRLTELVARLRLKFIKAAEISAVLEMDSEGRATHINRPSRAGEREQDDSERKRERETEKDEEEERRGGKKKTRKRNKGEEDGRRSRK